MIAHQPPVGIYFKMLIARAITNAPMQRDAAASVIISSLAHRLIAEMPVGLNAGAISPVATRGRPHHPDCTTLVSARGGSCEAAPPE